MRKIIVYSIVLLAAMVLGMAVKAQDIIFLTNGDEIEAKVLKVSETELEYKRYDNPDGPSYTKSLTNVFMVKYENGTKDVFTTPESIIRQQQKVAEYDGPEMGEHSPLTLNRSGANIASNVGALRNEDLQRLLGDEVWNDYLSARKGYDVGNTMAAFGMALGFVSGSCFFGAIASAKDGDGNAVGVFSVIGSIAFVAHAILTPVGYVRRGVSAGQISRIAERYNSYNKSLSMEIGAAPILFATGDGIAPGVGVTVRF